MIPDDPTTRADIEYVLQLAEFFNAITSQLDVDSRPYSSIRVAEAIRRLRQQYPRQNALDLDIAILKLDR